MGGHLHLWSMDVPPAMAILSNLMRATTGPGLVPVRWLATPWPYVAAVLAFALGSPSIAGQMHTGWTAVLYERELSWAYWREPQVRVVAVSCLVALGIIL
ncbi:MAG TPA: hypothetical protein VLD17_00090 [Gemmatimonadaceae bacterium]|nr:hypothetical protein [Gemmatimonadaceae bacterium]